MEVECSCQGEVAALRERGEHQSGKTAQVLIAVGEGGKALVQEARSFVAVPVVSQVSMYEESSR